MADPDRAVSHRPPEPSALAAVGRRLLALLEHHRPARALVIGLLAAAAALSLKWSGGLSRAELASYDRRVRAFAPGGRSSLIEVVDYDEVTVGRFEKNFGPWGGWPREVHADLVKAIARGKPRAIVLDLLFAGTSQSAGDADLVEACRAAGNVVLACSLDPARGQQPAAGEYEVLPETEAARLSLGPAGAGAATMQAAAWPFAELRAACRAVGSIHLEADEDETARAVSPAVNYAGRLWPTLSTAAAAVYLGEPPEIAPGLLRMGGHGFPLGSDGRRPIRWYGPNARLAPKATARYRSTSAGWVIESARKSKDWDAQAGIFEGKIVVAGCSAAGGFDHRETPLGREPGHFIHAAAIENLVLGDAVRRVGGGWTVLAALALALGAAGAFAAVSVRRAPLVGSVASLALAAAWAGAACLLYTRRGLWADLVVPEVAAGAALGGSLLAGYLVEGRSARRLRQGFARFLSPEVLAEVAADLDNLRPGMGRRREITIMFCDARGFTPISEKLAPEAAVELLDAYLGAMSDCILAHGGTLSKYIGDGIMAFWGAPAACPDHAGRAARAALDMVRAQEGLKQRRLAAGEPCFDIGIGLHSGEAVVGTVGSEQRLDYTAIGDAVNLASRVEGLTKDFQVRICATWDLAGRAGEKFEFRSLGRVQVKGRTAGVEVLELVGLKGESGPEGKA